MPEFPWIVICFAVFLIGLTKSGFGAGLGMMAVPIAALAMQRLPVYHGRPDAVLALLLPMFILGDLVAVLQYAREIDWRSIRRLLPGTIVGVCVGAALLYLLTRAGAIAGSLIKIEIGCESVALVLVHWWRLYRGHRGRLLPEPGRGLLAGGLSGTSSTLAHAAGPIIAVYLLPLNLGRRLLVGTSAMFFFITNAMKFPAYIASGVLGQVDLLFALRFTPCLLVGAVLGRMIIKRISDRAFTGVIYTLVFVLGWYLLYDGIGSLLGA